MDALPDLVPARVEVSPSNRLVITVKNIGACPAPASDTAIYFNYSAEMVKTGAPPSFRSDDGIHGGLKVPTLLSGQSAEVYWIVPDLYRGWKDGARWFTVNVNYKKLVREWDYSNNLLESAAPPK